MPNAKESKNKFIKRSSDKTPRKYFLLNDKTPFSIREAYRSVRTNLLSILSVCDADAKKHICFTSPESADGKTLNCANIAVSFAETGAKVLVIDADMRKPKLHRAFKIPSAPGLSECLGGFCQIKKAIVPCKEANGVCVLPAGKIPPNPTELILSSRFDELLRAVENEFDYIFIDAPPVCVVTDATIISKKTLGAVLVCRNDYTRVDDAKKAMNEIVQGGGKVLGSLLNGVDFGKLSQRSVFRKKYGYYDYEYKDSNDEV